VAKIGKAGPGNEADIAGADHGNAHGILLRKRLFEILKVGGLLAEAA
jgi:hypothetical protein